MRTDCAPVRHDAITCRVLVVDDDTEALRFVRTCLESAGMAVQATTDPDAVEARLQAFAPEVLILDMHMPHCSGADLAARLLARPGRPEFGIVYLTADALAAPTAGPQRPGLEVRLSKTEDDRLQAHLIEAVRQLAARVRQRGPSSLTSTDAAPRLEQYKSALDAHAIVSVTDASGRIVEVNDNFCRVSGYGREELVGRTHRLVNSGLHAPEVFAEMWRRIAAGRVWHGTLCNRAKSGNLYWVETTITPLLDAQDRPYQYISVRTDITRQKQIEHELKQARETAEKALRMKSQFLSSAQHEFRTPLNAVLGYAELLHGDGTLNDEQRECATGIREAGRQLLAIVDELIDLAVIEAGEMKVTSGDVELGAFLQQAAHAVASAAAEADLVFTTHLNQGLGLRLTTDAALLRKVLQHLLMNAIKFNQPGGQVRLSCKAYEAFVRIAVEDTGIGIAPEMNSRLFDAFDRLGHERSERMGLGVGLIVARKIARLLGGSLNYESMAGQGSNFWIDLPRHAHRS